VVLRVLVLLEVVACLVDRPVDHQPEVKVMRLVVVDLGTDLDVDPRLGRGGRIE
jgi:hypothetical protein